MTKKNKICIVLINVALGLFAAYTCLLCIRETHITKTQDTIVCNITKLYQKSGRSHHPKAYIVYRNKEYVSNINLGDSLRTGYNTTTFYYDEMLDRVFCRNSGIERGMYVIVIIFLLSFLFWIPSGRKSKGEKWRETGFAAVSRKYWKSQYSCSYLEVIFFLFVVWKRN